MAKSVGLSAWAEKKLIRQIQAGPSSAASAAFLKMETAYTPLIESVISRVGCNAELRKDLSQEVRIVFFKAIKNFDTYRGIGFAAYVPKYLATSLLGIRKAVIEEQKRQKVEVSLESLLEDTEATDDLFNLADIKTQDMLDGISESDMRRKAVGRFFAALSPTQMAVARRLYIMEESLTEAADALGTSRQSVFNTNKRILAVARVKLAQFA
jgi:RNA polymerase sigma factor (sigma-70 family)